MIFVQEKVFKIKIVECNGFDVTSSKCNMQKTVNVAYKMLKYKKRKLKLLNIFYLLLAGYFVQGLILLKISLKGKLVACLVALNFSTDQFTRPLKRYLTQSWS